MSRFLDGPARGVDLELRRAPLLLRVTRSPSGDWDALDQLDDEPKPDEIIYVYRREGEPTRAMVDWCDKGGRRRGGCREFADYQYVADAPVDAVLRNTDRWRDWAMTAARRRPGNPAT